MAMLINYGGAGEPSRIGAEGGSRTRMRFPSHDFESCVSTNSTTSALFLLKLSVFAPHYRTK